MKHARWFFALLIMCSMTFTVVSCGQSKEDKVAALMIKALEGDISKGKVEKKIIEIAGSEEAAEELVEKCLEREDVQEAFVKAGIAE